jgi:acyl-CoA synthetase (AMP-forming)/AMP-acid ligase II
MGRECRILHVELDNWLPIPGDTAALDTGMPPYWRILGRSSVDVLKSGGYKISAIDVENALLAAPGVAEAAVVGIPDSVYGQVVAAVIARDKSPGGRHPPVVVVFLGRRGSLLSRSDGGGDGPSE